MLGNSVNDNAVPTWLTLNCFRYVYRLGGNVWDGLTVYSLYKSHRETSFLAEEDADFFHVVSLSKCILKIRERNQARRINRLVVERRWGDKGCLVFTAQFGTCFPAFYI